MRGRLPATLVALLLTGAAQLEAQEHATARPEPVKVAPPAPTVVAPKNMNRTPTVPPAKVAAAIADAIRQAEHAAAKRSAQPSTRPTPPRRAPNASPARRYEVRWPTQRMVVHWPGETPDDRVTLTWPDTF